MAERERVFQEKLEELKKKVEEAKEAEKRARAELEQKKTGLTESKRKYLRLKLQNDQIDRDVEVQNSRRVGNIARGATQWQKIEKDLDDNTKKMDEIFAEMDATLVAENTMIMTYFRAVQDIPINFSEEILKQKVVEAEKKSQMMRERIKEVEKEVEAEMAQSTADGALRQERNDKLDAFYKDVKTATVEAEAELRRQRLRK